MIGRGVDVFWVVYRRVRARTGARDAVETCEGFRVRARRRLWTSRARGRGVAREPLMTVTD